MGVVESTRDLNGEISTERRYYLSSLPLNVEQFARAVRSHRGIENKLHWVLNFSLGEDRSRARAGYAVGNLATLRRMALNILRKDKSKKEESEPNSSALVGITPISSSSCPFRCVYPARDGCQGGRGFVGNGR